MNREQLKEHLHKLRCMLDELEDKDGRTSGKDRKSTRLNSSHT